MQLASGPVRKSGPKISAALRFFGFVRVEELRRAILLQGLFVVRLVRPQ